MKQLEEAGYVGLVKWQTEDGAELIDKKILTKKGTTDMDRIASQIHKESKKNKKWALPYLARCMSWGIFVTFINHSITLFSPASYLQSFD